MQTGILLNKVDFKMSIFLLENKNSDKEEMGYIQQTS
jgi:hypothetical protein